MHAHALLIKLGFIKTESTSTILRTFQENVFKTSTRINRTLFIIIIIIIFIIRSPGRGLGSPPPGYPVLCGRCHLRLWVISPDASFPLSPPVSRCRTRFLLPSGINVKASVFELFVFRISSILLVLVRVLPERVIRNWKTGSARLDDFPSAASTQSHAWRLLTKRSHLRTLQLKLIINC